MFRQLPTLFAGMILGLTLAGELALATQPAPRDAVVQLLVQADDEVAAIDRIAREVYDPNVRDRLLYRVRRLDAAIDESLVQLGRAPRPPGVAVVVTSEPELMGILAAVQNEAFSSGKLAVLASAAAGRPFTASQAGRLMDAFTFDDDKVEAGALLYPLVVDPQNWYTAYAHLTFDSSKADLRARTEGR
ncbi:MAG TPA: DUF4476 domain-containing protein [Myxococcota bacterium]|nr:DUF4476 domain-containing protein [Myxococcota bacterium]